MNYKNYSKNQNHKNLNVMLKSLELFLLGIAVGILVAPDKGSATRKKIAGNFFELKDNAEYYLLDAKDKLQSKVKDVASNVKNKANDLVDKAKDQANNLKNEADDMNHKIQNA